MKKTIGKSAVKATTPAARKSAPRKPAAQKPARNNALVDGIQALSDVHEEAVARQSRVFESILGLGGKRTAEAATNPLAALDPFGFRKFEDVFDQRVARSLEHLGLPTAHAFAALSAEVEGLRSRIAALEAAFEDRPGMADEPANSKQPTKKR